MPPSLWDSLVLNLDEFQVCKVWTIADKSVTYVEKDQPDEETPKYFSCCICLDLCYKPVVLCCGHTLCFWCVHTSMSGTRESKCPLCRLHYIQFPRICRKLHFLLANKYPDVYKRREKQTLENERRIRCFSPQLDDDVSDEVDGAPGIKSNENRKPITISYVLCVSCKQLPIRPVVLSCGDVYCQSCLSTLDTKKLECQECRFHHLGRLPNVCLELDNFLKEEYPDEHASRIRSTDGGSVGSFWGRALFILYSKLTNVWSRPPALLSENEPDFNRSSEGDESSFWLNVKAIHRGAGCDYCGMYPILGDRYKCLDCKEKIGFDLCESCYNNYAHLPGRFNQQHKSEHSFLLIGDEATWGKLPSYL